MHQATMMVWQEPPETLNDLMMKAEEGIVSLTVAAGPLKLLDEVPLTHAVTSKVLYLLCLKHHMYFCNLIE